MILQALYEYYQRKAKELAPEGFEKKEIKFIIQIDKDGSFIDLIDTREDKVGHFYILPKSIGRSGANAWHTTFLLWDHYGYILSHPKDDTPASLEMAMKQNKTFINNIKYLPDELKNDKGINAILKFYEKNQTEEVKKHILWNDCKSIPNCNMTFKLNEELILIPERDIVKTYQMHQLCTENVDKEDKIKGFCLITGNNEFITRLHTATPIQGSKSNAKIVSFQRNSGFDSYGKEQAYNSPVGQSAESAYSTALKFLLDKNSSNKFVLSDITTVFWAEKRIQDKSFNIEKCFQWIIDDSPQDDPDRGIHAVQGLYESIQSGKKIQKNNGRFYVLGLSPNAARISIRFWKTGAIVEFETMIKQHFDDFSIVHKEHEPEFLSLSKILRSIVLDYKMENVPPNLAGKMLECILDGTPYPETLLNLCINRIRAEASKKDQNGNSIQNVTRIRAAILKACINRKLRYYNVNTREVSMALDLENKDIGYLLGRLFAVLEQIQEKSSGGAGKLNSTIRDRYYGSFSSTPVTVFTILMKLKNNHLKKITGGLQKWFEDRIGEIMKDIDANNIPAHLTLQEQAKFAVGYYHQRMNK
ncbi:MAG TPA: type I-C CRISPR-associated protein Cas8c/Csd1 [Spirochaetota bacterium]|nr:type I-C CRISPR-associated protein Cas8c/Csd1 [Spirochaetota bacterium]